MFLGHKASLNTIEAVQLNMNVFASCGVLEALCA